MNTSVRATKWPAGELGHRGYQGFAFLLSLPCWWEEARGPEDGGILAPSISLSHRNSMLSTEVTSGGRAKGRGWGTQSDTSWLATTSARGWL